MISATSPKSTKKNFSFEQKHKKKRERKREKESLFKVISNSSHMTDSFLCLLSESLKTKKKRKQKSYITSGSFFCWVCVQVEISILFKFEWKSRVRLNHSDSFLFFYLTRKKLLYSNQENFIKLKKINSSRWNLSFWA